MVCVTPKRNDVVESIPAGLVALRKGTPAVPRQRSVRITYRRRVFPGVPVGGDVAAVVGGLTTVSPRKRCRTRGGHLGVFEVVRNRKGRLLKIETKAVTMEL